MKNQIVEPIAKIHSAAVCCNSPWLRKIEKNILNIVLTMSPAIFSILLTRKNFTKLRYKSIFVISSVLICLMITFNLIGISSKKLDRLVYKNWKTFYVKDGLPDNHIFAIKADGKKLWVGTEGGLALFENNKWKTWTENNGLPWNVISSIAVSPKTGDVWIAMFGGGLARFSGGRFDHFNQFNSGLANDVVYGITVIDNWVWAATTAGISSYNTKTKEWEIYTDKNAPMEEIWCYNADSREGKVYVAVWGGGVLEWDMKKKMWNAHRDPDREMEIDLFRDDGLIHNITTSTSYIDKVLWVSTYFGFSRYDGRHWRGYMEHDSGLSSNFINYTIGVDGNSCYNATDIGLSGLIDYKNDLWINYKKNEESDKTWTAFLLKGKKLIKTLSTNLSLPNHHVTTVELSGDHIWIGTGHGLARGKLK